MTHIVPFLLIITTTVSGPLSLWNHIFHKEDMKECETTKIEKQSESEAAGVYVCYDDSDIKVTMPDEFNPEDKWGFLDKYVDEIYDTYSTKGKTIEFTTHSGETIDIESKTFGKEVNKRMEKDALIYHLAEGKSEASRVPIFEKSECNDSIYDEYVEVSIEDQHVWYVKNGSVVMESDCVTGCVSKKNDTPKGVYYVFDKATNRSLRPKGSKSGSFVNVWMPFSPDGCGLHDATWRSSFGNSIYKTNGSHGCVNLPKDFAIELYDEVNVGCPVIVY